MTAPQVDGASSPPLTFEEAMDIAKDGRTLVQAALGAVAFLAISAFSIRDCELLSGSGIVKLPILDAEVPVRVFFVAAPLMLLLLFAYVQVDIRRAVEEVEASRHMPIWPFSELPLRKRGKGLSISVISNLIVWGAWPFVAALLAWRVLPLGDPWLAPLHVMSIMAALALSLWNFNKVAVRRAKSGKWVPRVTALLVVAGLATTGFVCHRSLRVSSLRVHYTDFKSADIAGLDLSRRDLSGANFTGAKLSQATLSDANLTRANFTNAELDSTTLCGASMDRALFRSAKARNADFRCGSQRFEGAATADFRDADLSAVDLSFSTLRRAPLANLSDAVLWKADLEGADLSGADLTAANLTSAKAARAKLNAVRGAHVNFYRAELPGAEFARAQLDRANFTASILTEATFVDATLTGAHLDGAQLGGASLQGCNLSGADITDATVLTGAHWDKFTVFPAGFDACARAMKYTGHEQDPCKSPRGHGR